MRDNTEVALIKAEIGSRIHRAGSATVTATRTVTMTVVAMTCLGCGTSSRPTPAPIPAEPPGRFSADLAILSSETFGELTEVLTIQSPDDYGPTAAVAYFPTTDLVVQVFPLNGRVTSHDALSGQLINDVWTGITSNGSIELLSGGRYVLGSLKVDLTTGLLTGIGVWNTESGENVLCLDQACSTHGTTSFDPVVVAASVADDLSQVATITRHSISYRNLGLGDASRVIMPLGEDSSRTLHDIVFSPTLDEYLIIYSDGGVARIRSGEDVVHTVTKPDATTPLAHVRDAKIDSTGQWLGIVWENITRIYHVDDGAVVREIEDSCTFVDFSAVYLYCAGNGQVSIYGLARDEVLYRFDAPDLIAFSVSDDQRVLSWADSLGEVHLMVVSKR